MPVRRGVLVIGTLAVIWYGYRWIFPDDEAQIRAVLQRIANAVGGAAEDGEVGRLARAASVRNQLDPGLTVDAGPPFDRLSGRDAVIGAVARLNSSIKELEVRFADVQITVDADRLSARVSLTAEARFRDARGARSVDARELDVTLRKHEGAWVVASVALVQTLQPVAPR